MERTNNSKDTRVKDILAKLSKNDDDAAVVLVEEVRKLVVQDLKSKSAVSPSKNDDVVSPNDEQKAGIRNIGGQLRTSEKESTIETGRVKGDGQTKKSEPEEELAFKISKDSDTYRNIYSMVQWYRDSFFIGSDFADERSAERQRSQEKLKQSTSETEQQISLPIHNPAKFVNSFYGMPFSATRIPPSDPSAMGYPLLLSTAESYIPSKDTVSLLKPSALWLVSKDGPMLRPATQSLAQSIPWGQISCDQAMRNNVLWVLKDEEWKEFAKNITTDYVDRSYREE